MTKDQNRTEAVAILASFCEARTPGYSFFGLGDNEPGIDEASAKVARIRQESAETSLKEAAERAKEKCRPFMTSAELSMLEGAILGNSVIKENLTTENKPETIRDVVVEYLKKNGYDGLCGVSCGCGIDDPFPCGEIRPGCSPGYKRTHKCGDCKALDSCDAADLERPETTCFFLEKE